MYGYEGGANPNRFFARVPTLPMLKVRSLIAAAAVRGWWWFPSTSAPKFEVKTNGMKSEHAFVKIMVRPCLKQAALDTKSEVDEWLRACLASHQCSYSVVFGVHDKVDPIREVTAVITSLQEAPLDDEGLIFLGSATTTLCPDMLAKALQHAVPAPPSVIRAGVSGITTSHMHRLVHAIATKNGTSRCIVWMKNHGTPWSWTVFPQKKNM